MVFVFMGPPCPVPGRSGSGPGDWAGVRASGSAGEVPTALSQNQTGQRDTRTRKKKKRVVTDARREQNREAQRLWRKFQGVADVKG